MVISALVLLDIAIGVVWLSIGLFRARILVLLVAFDYDLGGRGLLYSVYLSGCHLHAFLLTQVNVAAGVALWVKAALRI